MKIIGTRLNVVTGAFSFTGKYIAQKLLSIGEEVITLTGHPERASIFNFQVAAHPFNFDNPEKLVKSLEGAKTLYNTYWIRFPYKEMTFDKAVENTHILLRAAEKAGVSRIVHISIVGASETSPLPYFRGKGLAERIVRESKLSYAIVRPTVIFGLEGILINNIAYFLRRFPVFAILGAGNYQVQPVYVEDLAEIAIKAGKAKENMIIDAAGPELFTFKELVRLIAKSIKSSAKIIHVPPGPGLLLTRFIGYLVKDIVLTEDEVRGLMSNLLISKEPPTGHTPLSQWLAENSDRIGTKYISELKQHYR